MGDSLLYCTAAIFLMVAIFVIATFVLDAILNAIDGLALLHHGATATWMIR